MHHLQYNKLAIYLTILCTLFHTIKMEQRSFVIDKENNCFRKDGRPFRYISGSMHYFRVPKCHWNDRLKKMRAAGLNVVESYIAWHVHEQFPFQYDFSGENDLIQFIKLCQENDLLVILRPGPFIDAERDFGGLPWWLLKKKDIELRTSKSKSFMRAVEQWFSHLLPMLRPLVYSNGGPVIMIQIENEYGSYFACDQTYLEQLQLFYNKYLNAEVVYFSVDDGFREKELECGSLPTTFKTVDFGPTKDVRHGFDILRNLQPHGPLVNTEYYTGWLDHWGEPHQRRSTKLVVDQLDIVLKQNASVNLYMFEGGTNFGFTNGAELTETGEYKAVPTSYDYDAPLSEAGDPTEKYFTLKRLISQYLEPPHMRVPRPTVKAAYGKVKIGKMLTIFDALPFLLPRGPIRSKNVKTMEDINQNYGFILYRTMLDNLKDESSTITLKFESLHDRTILLVDQKYQATELRGDSIEVQVNSGKQLDILVENQGRVNYKYGSFTSLYDPKGIIGNVTLNDNILENWEIFPLPLNNTEKIPWETIENKPDFSFGVPSFYFGEFSAQEANDTFLRPSSFMKGQAFINDFNAGRYWMPMGPQETLYVPYSAIKKAPERNQLVLFEIDGLLGKRDDVYAEFLDKPIWKNG